MDNLEAAAGNSIIARSVRLLGFAFLPAGPSAIASCNGAESRTKWIVNVKVVSCNNVDFLMLAMVQS